MKKGSLGRDALKNTGTKDIASTSLVPFQDSQLAALGNLYLSIEDIDLRNNSILTVRANNNAVTGAVAEGTVQMDAQNMLLEVCDEAVAEGYQSVMRSFVDLSTLDKRLSSTDVVTMEYADDQGVWYRARFAAVERDAHGNVLHVLWLVESIDDEKKERDTFKSLWERDSLTGVRSKHAYVMRKNELNNSIAAGTAPEFAIAVCDVNDLKEVNDTYGYKAGDDYIREACKMVCDVFQHSPVFRIDDDEFVAILTGRDYAMRKELLTALHERSVGHVAGENAVVAGGLSSFRSWEDKSVYDVVLRASERMRDEKQLLKGMSVLTEDEDDGDQEADLFVELDVQQPIIKVKRHLLIVDDMELSQDVLANALHSGYELLFASDGYEALEQVRLHKDELALIILDLIMPRLSGIEVLKILRSDEELRKIPVIVITSDNEAELECLNLGAMDFIPKPFPKWEIIRARVSKCIELVEGRDTIRATERDGLTNLFNIDYFLRYVEMFDQHYYDMPMDAIVVDVIHFHMINERYGRSYGNLVLMRVGARIRSLVRKLGGVGCRRGADTFLLYCPHQEDYALLLEQLSAHLTEDESSANRIRLRLGVYSMVDKSLDIERRFDYAKSAANSVRKGYQGAIGIYDTQMHEAELYRERLLEDFRPSLENKRFKVYFQPKFDIRPSQPVLSSAEALVRWDHPQLGPISPTVFVPLFEDNGLILELDKFVWRETAARIRDWKNRFGYSVPVSVNVSRIDMLTPNLKAIFSEILDVYELSTDDLMLEITESAQTEDFDQVIATTSELRAMGMGFRIEMDDFGTGYSSLGMLSNLPIDVLKLDMSFVRGAFGETRDVRMIELIIDIADYMHVPVVAEGVETEEQYLVLKAMGCDYVQGFYFSRPVPPDGFDRFLVERGRTSVKMLPDERRSHMSISKALASNFQSIYYVDVISAFYLEFCKNDIGDLEPRPGGANFFADAYRKILANVCDEDAKRMREALSRNSLSRWIGQDEVEVLSFTQMLDGIPVPYVLQPIRTRGSDEHHIILGIRQVRA